LDSLLTLDRLHLLVQIVLALGLLHLPLDAAADLLLHLQHRDLALHQGVDFLQPLGDVEDFQQRLLVGNLDRQVRGDAVGQLARLDDLGDRGQGLGRHLLVQLDVVLELLGHGAAQRIGFGRVLAVLLEVGDLGFEIVALAGEAQQGRAALALDQHLDGAVRQLEQLQHAGDDADVVDGRRRGIVVGRALLGGQKDLFVALHHLFERPHGFVAADEKGNHHVREHHDVPQGQNRKDSDI
jgi:hypothetical protein